MVNAVSRGFYDDYGLFMFSMIYVITLHKKNSKCILSWFKLLILFSKRVFYFSTFNGIFL